MSQVVETHRAAARAAAGADHLGLIQTVCREPGAIVPAAANAPRPPRAVPPRDEWYAEPAQVFDNLYFVGTRDHGAWAVTTSEGIIVIDALYDYAVESAVVDGLRKLGLDPEDIAYVVVSHGHGDHHGGAKHLQDRFGAQVVMGGPDWDLVEGSTRDPIPNPRHGRDRRDATAARRDDRHSLLDARSHRGHGLDDDRGP